MNTISCNRHPGNDVNFILWNQNLLKFACDECLGDNQKEENWKKLVIRKAFKEPEYFLSRFDLDTQNKKIMNSLQNYPDAQLKDMIEQLEQQIKEIQLTLDKIVDDFKQQVIKINEYKTIQRQQLDKVKQYSEFKELIESLKNTTQRVPKDVMNQVLTKLQNIFWNLEKNSTSLNQEIQKEYKIPKIQLPQKTQGVQKLFEQIKVLKQIYWSYLQPELKSKVQLKVQLVYSEQLSLKSKIQSKEQSVQTDQTDYQQTTPQENKEQQFIVPDVYLKEILNKISLSTKKKVKQHELLFNKKKEDLNNQNFWNCVQNKKNLIIILKSQSGNIFGAYTPLKWIEKDEGSYDQSGSSFLFSYTHKSIHDYKDYMTVYLRKDKGPYFNDDLYIDGDFQNGSSELGRAFTKEASQDQQTHLFGQKTPDIIECQIFELIFE